MKLNRKIVLLTLIAVFAVIYVCQVLFTGKSKIKTLNAEGEITRIELTTSTQNFAAVKKDNLWTVGDKNYSADSSQVEKLVKELKSIRLLGEMASLNDANSDRYGFGGSSVTVKAFNGDKLLREIKVGKNTSTNSQSYITCDGKNTIYLAAGSLGTTFAVDMEALRSKQVVSMDTTLITKVEVNCKGSMYALGKSENGEWGTISEGNETAVDSSKVSSMVAAAAQLKCDSWKEDDFPLPRIMPECVITLTMPASSATLQIFQIEEDYLATCTTTPYVFKINKATVDKLEKTIDELK